MSLKGMQLKVFMPFAIFAEKTEVLSIVAETRDGSMGILPHRLDCVAMLGAGILSYTSATEGEVFIALDEGVLVKTGSDVLISTRRAVGGADLKSLHSLVQEEFRVLNEEEKSSHATMLKLETGFLRRFANFQQQ
jgi:F-type H+-transporting ATPase subunit epsilon